MTVKKFIEAVSKNSNLLDLELCVVTKIEKLNYGQFDGGAKFHYGSVESVTIGTKGLLFFPNQKTEHADILVMHDAVAQFPHIVVAGKTPDSFI